MIVSGMQQTHSLLDGPADAEAAAAMVTRAECWRRMRRIAARRSVVPCLPTGRYRLRVTLTMLVVTIV